MKGTYIIGIVWLAIIIGIISFGATIFFLGNKPNNETTNKVYDEQSSSVQKESFVTNESSVRTKNNMDIVIDEEDINNIMLEKSLNEMENNNLNIIESNIEESIESISLNTKSFIKPVKGEVLKPLSTDKLVYSKTLQEWTVHNGTDYKSKLGDEVYAIRSGKVKEINFNYVYGDYIIIEHDNGYESMYSNITVLDKLTVGKMLNQGEIIGYVAESYGFEAADETHLHFELKENGKLISIE